MGGLRETRRPKALVSMVEPMYEWPFLLILFGLAQYTGSSLVEAQTEQGIAASVVHSVGAEEVKSDCR